MSRRSEREGDRSHSFGARNKVLEAIPYCLHAFIHLHCTVFLTYSVFIVTLIYRTTLRQLHYASAGMIVNDEECGRYRPSDVCSKWEKTRKLSQGGLPLGKFEIHCRCTNLLGLFTSRCKTQNDRLVSGVPVCAHCVAWGRFIPHPQLVVEGESDGRRVEAGGKFLLPF